MIDTRDRISDHINRARLRLEARRAARPLALILAVGALALAGAAFIISEVSPTTLSDTYKASFVVDNTTGVVEGVSQVRVRGIPAGTISKVRLDGQRPVLTATIKSKYGRVFRDARATLRPNTALQDMYLDILDNGSKAAGVLPPGEPLPSRRTETAVAIPDVLNILRADQQVAVTQLLDGLGNGLEDRGARLRTAFAELAPLLDVAGQTARQAALRKRQTKALVHDVALLTTELGRRDRDLRRLVESSDAVLTPFREGQKDLDAVIAELPGTLGAVDTTFASVRGVLGDVDAATGALQPVAKRLPASLADIDRLRISGDRAVRALQRPIARLVPFAEALRPLSKNLASAFSALAPQTDTFAKVTKDLAGCKRAITGFFQWNTSLSKFGDARGPIPRGNLATGLQTTGAVASPDEYAPQACTGGKPIGGRPPRPEDGR